MHTGLDRQVSNTGDKWRLCGFPLLFEESAECF